MNNEPHSQSEEVFSKPITESAEFYSDYRDEHDQAIRVGIFGEDLSRALEDERTVLLEHEVEEGDARRTPLLVPLDILEWYNTDLLKRTYGDQVEAYYYAHPPVLSEEEHKRATSAIKEKLKAGAVVVSDKYQDDNDSPIANIISEALDNPDYSVEAFGGHDESRVDVFAGPLEVVGAESKIVESANLHDVYKQLVDSGEITYDEQNGAAFADVIEGDEAEEIWQIYDKPFQDLGENDPTYAGFDKEALIDILKDPEVVKVVNRVDGDITTLCIFLQNFEKAPWFNAKYYQDKFPEYFDTNNILMFPGIVSDETKRGNNYAADVIDLTANVLAKRGSGLLVTFECTEVSTTYIPDLVIAAVNNNGMVKIGGLEEPINVINYYALKQD